jgi:DNA-binding NarL/FixJ family response regulator
VLEATAALATISVLLVEPVAVIREALHSFLQTQPDFDVVAVSNTEAAVPLLVVGVVLVLSIDCATDETWRFIGDVRDRAAGVATILLSTDVRLDALRRALSEGVRGFIHKQADPAAFIMGIREVAAGETVVVGPGRLADAGAHAVRTLTRREVSILQLVGEDFTSQQIASRMGVSIRTVHAHLQNAYRKLDVNSRMAAVAEATRRGEIAARS